MSNIAIQGAATGTGVFTLASPATNTDRTLVLPDNSGTLVTTDDIPVELLSGSVIWFAANAAPTGYLKANGAAISRTTYAALFTAIGTTFGVGDGSTTFNVPDLRGEFIRGWDDGRGVDSGRAFGTAQEATQIGHMAAYGGDIIATNSDATNSVSRSKYNISNTVSFTRSDIFTRPRNIALLACIKF